MTTTAIALGRAGSSDSYRLTDAVRMEWLKFRSLRSMRWSTVVYVVAVIGIGIAILSYYPSHWAHETAANKAQFDPTSDGFAGMTLGQLAVGIMGVVVMTSEYSSGAIRSTLAAIPDRRLLLTAKALVLGGSALVVGLLTCLVAFAVNQYLVLGSLPSVHATLTQAAPVRAILLMGAYTALIGLLGVGIGAIVRHSAGGIAALVGVVFVLPLIGAFLPSSIQYSVGRYLPMAIAENSLSVVKPVAHAMAPWTGFVLVCGYAAVVLAAASWVLARRDA
jgi:ABC-2 type transport system permease protein